jgi:starch phosphorylase
VPTFYGREAGGPPAAWVEMIRDTLKTIGPNFGAGRMVRDYVERIYPPEVPPAVRG